MESGDVSKMTALLGGDTMSAFKWSFVILAVFFSAFRPVSGGTLTGKRFSCGHFLTNELCVMCQLQRETTQQRAISAVSVLLQTH